MSINGGGIKQNALRRWVSHLLLLAFVARAIIPAGYMPDFAAAAQGVFKVVICTASGQQSLTLDAEGNPVPEPSQQHHDQPCAFSGLTALNTPELTVLTIARPVYDMTQRVPLSYVLLPPARAGPAHGSRAPPTLS